MKLSPLLPMVVVLAASACTSFSTVRSARVDAGRSVALQASVTSKPGETAGWFWAFDCEQRCNYPVIGGDASFTYGWRPDSGRAYALSAGTSGVHPYLDGYMQATGGSRPFGIGARLGVPVTSWREHQLYARYDIPLGARSRVLFNPALFVHEGRSPNGANPGTFVGFVQGVGVMLEGERVSWTPAVAIVAGRAKRTSYGTSYGPTNTVFATASIGVVFHRKR